jgi:hypothetical protein
VGPGWVGVGRLLGLEEAFSKGIEDVDAMWVDSSFYLSLLLGTNSAGPLLGATEDSSFQAARLKGWFS